MAKEDKFVSYVHWVTPPLVRVVGFILLVGSVPSAIVTPGWAATITTLIFMLGIAAICLGHEKLVIDKSQQRIRLAYMVFVFPVGNWEPLPERMRVKLVPIKLTKSGYVGTVVKSTAVQETWELRAYEGDTEDYWVVKEGRKEKLEAKGQELASYVGATLEVLARR